MPICFSDNSPLSSNDLKEVCGSSLNCLYLFLLAGDAVSPNSEQYFLQVCAIHGDGDWLPIRCVQNVIRTVVMEMY